jgi:hypothetical protein
MGLVLNEDQFAKIPIVGDDSSSFPKGDREDIGIGQAYRIVASDSGDVVPQV